MRERIKKQSEKKHLDIFFFHYQNWIVSYLLFCCITHPSWSSHHLWDISVVSNEKWHFTDAVKMSNIISHSNWSLDGCFCATTIPNFCLFSDLWHSHSTHENPNWLKCTLSVRLTARTTEAVLEDKLRCQGVVVNCYKVCPPAGPLFQAPLAPFYSISQSALQLSFQHWSSLPRTYNISLSLLKHLSNSLSVWKKILTTYFPVVHDKKRH